MILKHQIHGKSVLVHLNKAYALFNQIDYSLIPLAKKSPSHPVNSLADECILEIFQYLSVKDLTNVANVCKKFRRNAQSTFSEKFSNVEVSAINDMDKSTLSRFFCNFGPLIQSFELNCSNMVFGSWKNHVKIFLRFCAVPENALGELIIINSSEALRNYFEHDFNLLAERQTTLLYEKRYGSPYGTFRKSTGRRDE